jgi:hypothetical protein
MFICFLNPLQGGSSQFPGVLVGTPHVRKCHQMSSKEHIQLGWVVRWVLSTPPALALGGTAWSTKVLSERVLGGASTWTLFRFRPRRLELAPTASRAKREFFFRSSKCQHRRQKNRCKGCGTGYCQHGRLKSQCRDCGTEKARVSHNKGRCSGYKGRLGLLLLALPPPTPHPPRRRASAAVAVFISGFLCNPLKPQSQDLARTRSRGPRVKLS